MPAFRAYRLSAAQPQPEGHFVDLDENALSPGDTLVRVAYASVNYKDALAAAGRPGLIREYPRIGGIDLAGTIESSADASLAPGTPVVVHGFGVGIDHDGGYAQFARVPAAWVLPIPAGLTMLDAATIGVAGYTSALSVDLMELNGLAPGNGPVVVTGATGGAASFAIDMLHGRGHHVAAVTGKAGEADYLRSLGAAEVLQRETFGPGTRPLDKATWAGAVDTVGGQTLAAVIRAMQLNGVIAAFGNAAGAELPTTVLPFILRGVRLIGVNGNSPMPLRTRIWQRLATDLKPQHMAAIRRVIGFRELPQALAQVLAGGARGRFVIDVNA